MKSLLTNVLFVLILLNSYNALAAYKLTVNNLTNKEMSVIKLGAFENEKLEGPTKIPAQSTAMLKFIDSVQDTFGSANLYFANVNNLQNYCEFSLKRLVKTYTVSATGERQNCDLVRKDVDAGTLAISE